MSLSNKIKVGAIGGLLILAVSLLLSDTALPTSPELYNLKRLQEKIFMAVKIDPDSKVNYYNLLLDKRLAELTSLVEDRQFNLVLTSSLRYSTTAGLLTELIREQRLTSAAALTLAKFRMHQTKLHALDESFPKDESGEWKFVQDGYNYLALYSQQLVETFGDDLKVQ